MILIGKTCVLLKYTQLDEQTEIDLLSYDEAILLKIRSRCLQTFTFWEGCAIIIKKSEEGDNMKRNASEVSKLSPAFMTGGGGENFERRVAAVFVLSMIIDGLSPIVDAPIKKLSFQAKHQGYDVDDFVVTAQRGEKIKKLHCQVKHDLVVSVADSTFQEVITAAWKDFNKSSFNKKADLIALITGFIAKDSIDALRYLHDQALAAGDAEDYQNRINLARFTSKERKYRYEAVKECIQAANDDEPATDEELWQFFRCFILAVFDIDYENSVNQSLIHSLIKCKTDQDARLVWSRIADKCGYWKPAAATVTKDSIPEDILELFGAIDDNDIEIPLPPTFAPTDAWAVAVLVGAWSEKNNADMQSIEALAGTTYAVFQAECRKHLDTDLITLKNGIWRVHNRTVLLEAVWDRYFDDSVQNAFRLAREYLKEVNKQFGEDGEFSNVIPESGRFSNSDYFRKGLMEGLCILANGRKPAHCSDHLIRNESVRLVQSVFEDCDWKRLVSMADLLYLLGEICPGTYLNCLERFIYSNPQEMLRLFPKKNASFPDWNFSSEVLFSLERLAWHEDYLVQTVVCLGALEELDYEETNWVNTPLNSMISILNPYWTQTMAPYEKFQNAIQAVGVDHPDVCWNLCCSMLTRNCVVGMTNNPYPKYILRGREIHAVLSGEERDGLRKFYANQVLTTVGTSPDRFQKIIKNMTALPSENLMTFYEHVRSASVAWSGDEKGEIWSKLTDWKYRFIFHNDNQDPSTPEFQELCDVIEVIRPESSLVRYKRLFRSHYSEYSDDPNRWEKKEQQKQSAVIEIYQKYGIHALIEFGEELDSDFDVGYRLGQYISTEEMSDIILMREAGKHERFYANLAGSFFKKNGISQIKNIRNTVDDPDLMQYLLCQAPFSQELIDIVPACLPGNEARFWETVRIAPYYFRHADYDVISVVKTLMQRQRAPAAISLLGDAVEKLQPDPQLICKMLVQAPNEQEHERIDRDSTRTLIKYLQDSGAIDVKLLSEIEFFYLVWLDDYSDVKPRALEYRLANEPSCFCELMSVTYKKRHAEARPRSISKALRERLFQLTFHYRIIPGTDWDGNFHSDVFENWLRTVIAWAKENDRYEVSMQTVGNALSYVTFGDNGLIDATIMAALNRIDNDELRRGYHLGVFNQRGVHWIDPEGKPEKELARTYQTRADAVEKVGYSRFAGLLRRIADSFLKEAEEHIKEHAEELDD